MKKNLVVKLCVFALISVSSHLNAQSIRNVIPDTPRPFKFKVITDNSKVDRGIGTRKAPTITHNITQLGVNNSMLNRYQQQLDQYERDRKTVLQREEYMKKLNKEIALSITKRRINYTLQTYENDPGANYYYEAFEQLQRMNPDKFSLQEVTFLIENAFYNGKLDKQKFDKTISNISDFIKRAIRNQNLDPKNNLAKNLTIYQFITDTLTVDGTTHKPYTYDFDDYWGRENWDNMFVSKLLYQGDGQCNSMPQLYLILAEQLEAESYLALAPNHSFIRFKDHIGEWHNVELTSGAIMSDIFMLESGFMKAETIQNGNYITARTKRQLMSKLLNDLASGYISKFGYDEFVQKIINRSLELNPNGINTNIHQLNIQLARMTYVAQQLEAKSPKELSPYPEAVALFKELVAQEKKLKKIGFEEMPRERYEAWLESMNKEKEKQDYQKIKGLKQRIKLKD